MRTGRSPLGRYRCHGPACGKLFAATAEKAHLHCSATCRQAHAGELGSLRAELHARGFVEDRETPNLLRKDGVTLTLESCRGDLQRALERHAKTVKNLSDAARAR